MRSIRENGSLQLSHAGLQKMRTFEIHHSQLELLSSRGVSMGRKKKYTSKAVQAFREQQTQAITRDLTTYASLIGQTFAARLNMLAQVIGDVHHVSLGNYKERLLSSTIRNHLPKSYGVGTGFVLFPKERATGSNLPPGYDELNQSDYEVSRQCDILIYERSTIPVVFQDGDFVVLRPEAVRAVIEVKGALDVDEIDSIVDQFIDFGEKWQRCREFYSDHHQPYLQQPTLCAMAWRVDIDAAGRPKTDGARYRARIAKLYKERVKRSGLHGLPVISHAFIYDDSCVTLTTYSIDNGDPEFSVGWYTTPGKFTRFDVEENPRFEGDRTVASLIAAIQVSLDSNLDQSFNRFFSYLDETRADLVKFEHLGFSLWLDDRADIDSLFAYLLTKK